MVVVSELVQFGPWVVVLVLIICDTRQFDPDSAPRKGQLSAVEVCGVSWERHHFLQRVCFDHRRGFVVYGGFESDSGGQDYFVYMGGE